MAEKCDNYTKEEIYKLIELVNEILPLTAMGLFDVNKYTLTNIFGTILTYLIITVQFQMGNK